MCAQSSYLLPADLHLPFQQITKIQNLVDTNALFGFTQKIWIIFLQTIEDSMLTETPKCTTSTFSVWWLICLHFGSVHAVVWMCVDCVTVCDNCTDTMAYMDINIPLVLFCHLHTMEVCVSVLYNVIFTFRFWCDVHLNLPCVASHAHTHSHSRNKQIRHF